MDKNAKAYLIATDKATPLWLDTSDSKLWAYHKPQQGGGDYPSIINQHLYITSDEEIKDGDWYCYYYGANDSGNGVAQQTPQGVKTMAEAELKGDTYKNTHRKIIVTTDELFVGIPSGKTSLEIKGVYVPQIPQSFITAYVKAYNEGTPITKVELEYEEYVDYLNAAHGSIRLKLTDNNEAIIKVEEEITSGNKITVNCSNLGCEKTFCDGINHSFGEVLQNDWVIDEDAKQVIKDGGWKEKMYTRDEVIAFGKECAEFGYENELDNEGQLTEDWIKENLK